MIKTALEYSTENFMAPTRGELAVHERPLELSTERMRSPSLPRLEEVLTEINLPVIGSQTKGLDRRLDIRVVGTERNTAISLRST